MRWHEAQLVEDREDTTPLTAIDTLWVKRHDPPRELISDQESGIALSDTTRKYFGRHGIKLRPRGKGQHAWFIERRGALLRDTIHRVEGQLKEEGITDIPFDCILAEAVFAGKAMLTVGGSTPLQRTIWESATHPPKHRSD